MTSLAVAGPLLLLSYALVARRPGVPEVADAVRPITARLQR